MDQAEATIKRIISEIIAESEQSVEADIDASPAWHQSLHDLRGFMSLFGYTFLREAQDDLVAVEYNLRAMVAMGAYTPDLAAEEIDRAYRAARLVAKLDAILFIIDLREQTGVED